MKRTLKGRMTVEASYLVPFVLFLFVTITQIVFYFHDKNILAGAAEETALYAVQTMRKTERFEEGNAKGYFGKRIRGKLLLFGNASVDIQGNDREVTVNARARKGLLSLHVVRKTAVTEPEHKIRERRRLEWK